MSISSRLRRPEAVARRLRPRCGACDSFPYGFRCFSETERAAVLDRIRLWRQACTCGCRSDAICAADVCPPAARRGTTLA